MGTSNSASGPKGNQPNLLPHWAPEGPMPPTLPTSPPPDNNGGDQPKDQQQNQTSHDNLRPPSVSWNLPKISLTSFANRGGSGRLKRAARNYVKARGGASTAAITGRSGRKTTARLANFIATGIREGFAEVARKLGIQDITSRNVHSVLADFIDKIAPIGATVENAIARKALIATITEVFEDMEVERKGIGVLDQIKKEDMQKIITSSIANYINERFQQELINRLERSKIDADYANQLSTQIRDYIIGLIKLDMDVNNIDNFDWESPEGTKRIQDYYNKAYRLLGEEE
jgi:hypothetical protein